MTGAQFVASAVLLILALLLLDVLAMLRAAR